MLTFVGLCGCLSQPHQCSLQHSFQLSPSFQSPGTQRPFLKGIELCPSKRHLWNYFPALNEGKEQSDAENVGEPVAAGVPPGPGCWAVHRCAGCSAGLCCRDLLWTPQPWAHTQGRTAVKDLFDKGTLLWCSQDVLCPCHYAAIVASGSWRCVQRGVSGVCGTRVQLLTWNQAELPPWLWRVPAWSTGTGSKPGTLPWAESCRPPSTRRSEEKSETQAFPGENEDTGFLRLVLLQTCLYLGFHMIKKQQDVRLSGLWEKMSQSGHNWFEKESSAAPSPTPPSALCSSVLGWLPGQVGEEDFQTSTVF